MTKQLRIGDHVIVRPGFGAEAPIEVTITGFGRKNGQQLFDYVHPVQRCTRWAYFHQIVRVEEVR